MGDQHVFVVCSDGVVGPVGAAGDDLRVAVGAGVDHGVLVVQLGFPPFHAQHNARRAQRVALAELAAVGGAVEQHVDPHAARVGVDQRLCQRRAGEGEHRHLDAGVGAGERGDHARLDAVGWGKGDFQRAARDRGAVRGVVGLFGVELAAKHLVEFGGVDVRNDGGGDDERVFAITHKGVVGKVRAAGPRHAAVEHRELVMHQGGVGSAIGVAVGDERDTGVAQRAIEGRVRGQIAVFVVADDAHRHAARLRCEQGIAHAGAVEVVQRNVDTGAGLRRQSGEQAVGSGGHAGVGVLQAAQEEGRDAFGGRGGEPERRGGGQPEQQEESSKRAASSDVVHGGPVSSSQDSEVRIQQAAGMHG